jgi:hypothetical protein
LTVPTGFGPLNGEHTVCDDEPLPKATVPPPAAAISENTLLLRVVKPEFSPMTNMPPPPCRKLRYAGLVVPGDRRRVAEADVPHLPVGRQVHRARVGHGDRVADRRVEGLQLLRDAGRGAGLRRGRRAVDDEDLGVGAGRGDRRKRTRLQRIGRSACWLR